MTTENNVWEGLEESFNSNIQVDMGILKEHIPEDYKSILEPIKTPKDLVDSFVNAQRTIGKKQEITEDKAYEALGAITSADGFKFEDIKADEATLNTIKETFAGVKMNNKQAETVLKKFIELEQNKSTAEEKMFGEFKEKQLEARKGKYGEKLSEAEGVVNFAINKLAKGNEDFEKALKTLLDDNNYFDMFKEIGTTLKGDNPNGPSDKMNTNKDINPLKNEYEDYMNPKSELGKLYLGGPGLDQDKVLKARQRVAEIYKEAEAKNISLH